MNNNLISSDKLANTYASFITKERINKTALPQIQVSQNKINNDKFEKKYGLYYTAGAFAAGAGILFVLHRGGKLFNLTNYIKKKITKLSAKVSEFTEKSKNQNMGFFEKTKIKLYLLGSNVWKKTLEVTNVFCNLNPFKDIAFDRIMKATHLKGGFDWITKVFTKSAKKLANNKYNGPKKELAKLQEYLLEAAQNMRNMKKCNFKGEIISGEEAAQKITQMATDLRQELNKITDENFSIRFDRIVKLLNETSEKEFLEVFKNYKGKKLKHKIAEKLKECGDYIPQKIMEPYKNKVFDSLLKRKQLISNNILDLEKNLSKAIDDIFYNNSMDNSQIRQSYLKLTDLLKKFKSPKNFQGVKRADIRTEIINELNSAAYKFKEINPDSKEAKNLENLVQTILNDKKGLVEEAVSSCKELKDLNPNLYTKLIAQRNKFQKSFANAIDFETNKTYNKLLDFSLHSLATDIMSMLLGFGTISYIALNKKQNKQEKISANLEFGIPLVGGMLVGFLCNLRQVASGTGAIILGLISTAILNRIGAVSSNVYMKKAVPNKNTQIASK